MNNNNQFHRLSLMLGENGLKKIRQSFVSIVGLGAVGSFVTEALARAGVGRLRLIDFDVVKPSNLNRQLFALWETMGRKKHEIAAERVKAISPDCEVEALDLFVHNDTVYHVFEPNNQGQKPDMVVDAIDSLNPKIELLSVLIRSQIPMISSMGAALRTDPTKIDIGLLTEVTYCPLAALLRKHLRRRGISTDFPCVFSREPVRMKPDRNLLPVEESEENFLPQGRKRSTMGSLPTITGIFGLVIANEVILKLADMGGFKLPKSETY